jgi:hypothetical protein
MSPNDVATLIGMVSEQTRAIGALDCKVDGVISRLGSLETARAVADDRAVRADEVAVSHILSFRWRAGIAIAATGGCFGALSAIVGGIRLATGH